MRPVYESSAREMFTVGQITMKFFAICLFIWSFMSSITALSDVTGSVLTDKAGMIAAFGDFNGDKHADIFVIAANGSSVIVHLADNVKLAEKKHTFTKLVLLDGKVIGDDWVVTSVVPADFDGDAQMDVMVTLAARNDTDGPVTVKLFWGRQTAIDPKTPVVLPDLLDQPLLLDGNADMIPDLLGEKSSGERYIWYFSKQRNYTEKKFPPERHFPPKPKKHVALPPLRKPQSSAFVDLNGDLTADLCIVSMINEVPTLEFWYNKNGAWLWDKNVSVTTDKDLKVIGQFTFADFDSDQQIDIIVPACLDTECEKSIILVYTGDKWVELPIGLDYADVTWNFEPHINEGHLEFMKMPITLRVGDFNLDGYPDLLAVLGNKLGDTKRSVILENVGCGSGCGGFSRTFRVDWDLWLGDHEGKDLLPAFFDLNDNGILDIVVTSVLAQGEPQIRVWEHKFVDDACFIKVMVVSGLCFYDCPGNKEPYGVNQPGPVIRYQTTDLNGHPQKGTESQLSQSAYLPLQLPYTVFGLGQTPNFIDKLEVGIPRNSNKLRQREWSSVIPNSQLVIIPYPLDSPSSWTNKLFVTPSRLMLLTGAALLGTCGFIAGIVAILHWREKVEDRKEKRQESQRFHFDAM